MEGNFAKMFEEMEQYLMRGKEEWRGKEIGERDELMKEGKGVGYGDVEKDVLRDEKVYYHYLNMREKE
ncbi:hypothetical protein [Bacillus pumilus]|uniref:hypothetical protein n=1 Tax=Bacillus pumilus TaxID=1408 RepID=UPI0021B2E2C5|nr:hypothetical protein [Bacillus pumilus]